MRSRLARLGMILGALLGLLGVMTPPAQADTIGTVVFVGTAETSAGLGYPCFPGATTTTTLPSGGTNITTNVSHPNCPQGVGNVTNTVGHEGVTTTIDPLETLPLATIETLPLPNSPPNASVRVHGAPTRGFTGSTQLCVGVAVNNIDKLTKPPVAAGTCELTFTGVVNGWCGLSQAQGTAVFVDATGNIYIIDFHFTGVGGTLVVDGHARKAGQPGPHFTLVVGIVEAVPVPSTTLGNSCSSGTASVFTIVGEATLVIINDLPPQP